MFGLVYPQFGTKCLCFLCSAASGPLGLDALGRDCSPGRRSGNLIIKQSGTLRPHSHSGTEAKSKEITLPCKCLHPFSYGLNQDSSHPFFLQCEQDSSDWVGCIFAQRVFYGTYHWAMCSRCVPTCTPLEIDLTHCHNALSPLAWIHQCPCFQHSSQSVPVFLLLTQVTLLSLLKRLQWETVRFLAGNSIFPQA